MDIKNVEAALNLQQDLMANIKKHMAVLGKGSAPSLEELLGDKEQMMLQNTASLKAAEQEKAEAANRWQEQIDRCQASIKSLRQEIAEIKKRIKK